jgi:hypothetical protein
MTINDVIFYDLVTDGNGHYARVKINSNNNKHYKYIDSYWVTDTDRKQAILVTDFYD